MLKPQPTPSEYFIGAISQAYTRARERYDEVTSSAIWDHICAWAIPRIGSFAELFAWDTRPGPQNRIRTIRDTIAAGHVPGLTQAKNAKGREIVVRSEIKQQC